MKERLKYKFLAKLNENEMDIIMSKSKYGEIYRNALELYSKKHYIKAINEFKKVGNYKESQKYILLCRVNELKKKESLNDVILREDFEKIEFLLESGVNPNSCRVVHTEKGDNYYTPLGECINKVKNIDMARLLIKYGANVNGIDKIHFEESYEERCMLHQALFTENYDMVKLLLENGAFANSIRLEQVGEDRAVYSLLSDCVKKVNNVKIAGLLIKYGADVNRKDKYSNINKQVTSKTLLYYAVAAENYDMVKLLLENGITVMNNNGTQDGLEEEYILKCAATSKNREMVKLLLESGIDTKADEEIKFKNKKYREDFMLPMAVDAGNYEIVELLLERGGDPNLQTKWADSRGGRLLGLCIRSGRKRRLEVAELLIKYGANVNQIFEEVISGGHKEMSILNLAILLNDHEMVKLLISNGASIKQVSKKCIDGKYTFGMCVLGEVICHFSGENLKEIVKLLLEKGASMDDQIEFKGISISIKDYPFELNCTEDQQFLESVGWKGSKISTSVKRNLLAYLSEYI